VLAVAVVLLVAVVVRRRFGRRRRRGGRDRRQADGRLLGEGVHAREQRFRKRGGHAPRVDERDRSMLELRDVACLCARAFAGDLVREGDQRRGVRTREVRAAAAAPGERGDGGEQRKLRTTSRWDPLPTPV
jgi:hypothetical protein